MNEESLFAAALEQSNPAERQAFLEEACGGDIGLRRRLERLLAADGQTAGILSRSAAAVLETSDVTPLAAGEVLAGRFKLRQRLGAGGMGEVWVADQVEPVQRRIALKLIRPGLDSAGLIARFDQERQALALMDHPGIAKVLDAGATESGRPYFVMELIKGVPITEYCDTTKLSPRERLELFISVCQAVQHAHQKGIIHRDLKPSNVLVALYDGKPVAKVIDFGIAKATGERLSEHSVYTEVGALVGTLEYMSPEQAELNNLDIDTRSDVYSLGVLLYELLTGGVPHSRKQLRSAPFAEMLRIIKEVEPPRPSTRLALDSETLPAVAAARQTEPKKLTALVRGELDWIVMKALEKDRSRRYETANGLALDVQRYLSDEPVLACPPSARYRLRKFARRNKGKLAIAASVFLAVAVMAASIGWAVRDIAARQKEVEQRETGRLATVENHVRESLNAARTLSAENKVASAREKLAQAKSQMGNDGPALGNLAAEVAAAAADLDRFQQFQDLIERAHQAEMAPLLAATSSADDSLGSVRTQAPPRTGDRRPDAAVPFLLEALQCYGVLNSDDWTSTLEGGFLGVQQAEQIRRLAYEELLWLADDVARRRQGHRSEGKLSPEAASRQALAYLDKAESAHRPTPALHTLRALCRKALGEEAAAQVDTQLAAATHPTMAVDHYLRGQAAYDANRLDGGVQAFEEALRREPTHYWSMMKLGYCLCDLGRGPEDFVGAARVFTGCILKRPDHAHAYFCRANAYIKLRRNEQALADSSTAITLDPKHAPAWCVRGWAHNELGQSDEAVVDCSQAIALDPKDALAWNNRGAAYDKLNQPDKALSDFSQAIALEPEYAHGWYYRGTVFSRLGQTDQALTNFSQAIDLDPKHVQAFFARGVAYSKRGEPNKAVTDFSRVVKLNPKDAPAWANRGSAYSELGQQDQALADCTEAIKLDPILMLAWYNRGTIYDKLGKLNEAVGDFSKAIDLEPKFAKAWYYRGLLYDKQKEPAKAVTDFSRAIDLDPKLALAWYSRGVVYNKLGQTAEAITDYTEAIKLDPKHVQTWNNRGLAYSKLGQTDEAIADLSQAIELDPTHVSAWSGRGWVYNKQGQLGKAIADFSKAIELDRNYPQLVSVYRLRAQANSQLGHFELARTDYQTALKRDPAHAWTNSTLAWLLATCPDSKLRDPGLAVELAKKAAQLAPREGTCWKALGVAQYRAGDWKAAVAALDKARELGQAGDAVDWFFLAMSHRKLGKHDEARRAYAQAVQWLEKNQKALESDQAQAEDLRRFRKEAEEVLELKKK